MDILRDNLIGFSLFNLVSVFLGVGAILLSYIIYYRQTRITDNIHNIVKSTENNTADIHKIVASTESSTADIRQIIEATRNLSFKIKQLTERNIQHNCDIKKVKKLFLLNDDTEYKCIVPVKTGDKPLPQISQGDFYAVYIISRSLDSDQLKLVEVEFGGEPTQGQLALSGDNLLFLCSPAANPLLGRFYPSLKIKDGVQTVHRIDDFRNESITPEFIEKADALNTLINQIKLPCWFIDNEQQAEGRSFTKRAILRIDTRKQIAAPIYSPSDNEYIDALQCKPRSTREVCDYGIFARLTQENGNNYFILSGIHQYGTWIVADYLKKVVCDNTFDIEQKYRDVFEDKNDFIAIISGFYSPETFEIIHSSIHNELLWCKRNDEWVKFKKLRPAL